VNLVAFAVFPAGLAIGVNRIGYPYVALIVDMDPMGPNEPARPEASNQIAVPVEKHDRVKIASYAAAFAAALKHPDVSG